MRAVSLGGSTPRALANLSLAEDHAALSSFRELMHQFPDDLALLRAVVHCLLKAGQPGAAVALCTEGLARAGALEDGAGDAVRLTLLRLRAGVRSELDEHVAADIARLWAFAGTAQRRPLRRSVLGILLAIDRVHAVALVRRLSSDGALAPEVRRVLAAKLTELEVLAAEYG